MRMLRETVHHCENHALAMDARQPLHEIHSNVRPNQRGYL